MFELKIGEEIVNLKWGTYAMKVFGELDGKPTVDHFFDVIAEFDPEKPVMEKNRMFGILEKMLIAGHQNATGTRVDERAADGWIDACGGILKLNEGQMIDYINYIISVTLTGVTPLPGDEQSIEKKSDVNHGTTS